MLFNSKWITYRTGEYKSADDKYGNPSPYFRKTFRSNGEVKKAEILVSALGLFKIYINGCAASDDYLSPGWVDYSKKLPFVRYDVTDKIRQNNAIGVVLGDGWAVGHIGSNHSFKRCGYSDRIEFTAVVRIEYADGTTDEIPSDGTWKASAGAIRRSDIYMGEYIDNRLGIGDFSEYCYDDSAWEFAEEIDPCFSKSAYLEEAKIPPVVVKHTFKPKLVSSKENVYIYDVSQNIAGVLRCVFSGEKGTEFVIRHSELLENGRLYTENLRKAEATDTFILSGRGEEVFRPLFTFHGFRYAEITVKGNGKICDVAAESMYSDLETAGEFSCSNDIVNKIYSNALWSQRDNFLNVPTDCPQRDERLGWTADAQIFCQSAVYNMDCRLFYEKYLSDIRDAQLGNGVIPVFAPMSHTERYEYTGHDAAAGWCEAVGEIAYCHYKMYGDKKIVRDNLPSLKKLIDYYLTESPDYIRNCTNSFGDWLSLGNPNDLAVISTLYYARAAYLAYKLCGAVGDYEEEYYNGLYLKIKEVFCQKFVDSCGVIKSDTQTAYAVAYSFGIIDKASARKNLVRKFDEDGGKLTCGFLGIKFLLPVLCTIGRADIAYSLITSTDYPGWGYSVVNGATTIWERWDSYTESDGIKKGMNSFNHYSFGSCTEWMYEYCLGIKPDFDKPALEEILFSPYFDRSGAITHAEGHYKDIYVKWERNGEFFDYSVRVPEGTKCRFAFENAIVEKESYNNGEYCFRLK